MTRIVGTSVPRKEGKPKLLGQALYVDDITMPDMLYGATVRSTIPRGRITSITFSPDIPWHEFTIVTADDIPGRNMVPMFLEDQPLLAQEFINHPYEPILLLAHPDRERLAAAAAAVTITYEKLPAIFTIEDSLARKEIIWGEDNTFKKFHLEHGPVDEAFATADLIVEGEYTTGAQEQLYIETNGMIAEASRRSRHRLGLAAMPLLRPPRPQDHLRPPRRKASASSRLKPAEPLAARKTTPASSPATPRYSRLKSGRPVKMIYDRAEDMAATTKRHPSRTRHRTAVSRDGKLLAADIQIVIDGGAYATLSATVCSRATIHAAGPYQWPAIRVRSYAVATNTPPSGAFRGFGAPQSLFAMERHMDKIARTLGLTAEELRRRNFIRAGGTTATGQTIHQPIDLDALLNRALEVSELPRKDRRLRPRKQDQLHQARHRLRHLHARRRLHRFRRALPQLARRPRSHRRRPRPRPRLLRRVRPGHQHHPRPDRRRIPQRRIRPRRRRPARHRRRPQLRPHRRLPHRDGRRRPRRPSRGQHGGNPPPRRLPRRRLHPRRVRPRRPRLHAPVRRAKKLPPLRAPANIFWDDQAYMGDAYPTYAWAVYVAEVAVDTTTYTPTVTRFDALQEIGKVIHPILAAGQIEGGVAQGIGYALYEKVRLARRLACSTTA